MPIQTDIRIRIDGEPMMKFSSIGISQSVLGHHTFFIKQSLPKAFVSEAIDRAQGYVGQSVYMEIQPKNIRDNNTPLVFHGMVTEVYVNRKGGAAGEIVISGTSPTILLDGVADTRSYIGEDLSAVVWNTIGSHKERLKLNMEIDRDTALDYTVQYKESDFAFLCRLARKKGKWFYYNGTELVFGKPKSQYFSLVYGQNVSEFSRQMGIKPLGFQYLGYDPEYAETQKMGAMEISYESRGLTQAMLQASKKIFPDNGAGLYYHHSITAGNAQSHLHDRVRTQLQGKAAGLVNAKGISTETGLRIGDIVHVKEPRYSLTGDPADEVKEDSFGSYYITSIRHLCDETGNYSNDFTAVPDTVEAPPYTNVLTPPVAETQPAVVIDNNDPKGLGRVKVKFHWNYESPWIRMVQPHGGGDKGFYFIPEKGEEVLVAFEGGNAEKPYITGTMYNGSQKSGYATANNDLKVIHTRSGHIIKLDDTKGEESITITDKNKNIVFIDTANNNIDVTANETMTLTAKNMQINVEENMDIQVGNNKSEIVGNDHMFKANNNDVQVNEEIKVISATYKQQAQEMTTDTSGEIKTNAGGLITIASAEGVDYGE
ncbi:type VI secretion system Vgr family protein [Sinomicrobium sp. M5D2P9]